MSTPFAARFCHGSSVVKILPQRAMLQLDVQQHAIARGFTNISTDRDSLFISPLIRTTMRSPTSRSRGWQKRRLHQPPPARCGRDLSTLCLAVLPGKTASYNGDTVEDKRLQGRTRAPVVATATSVTFDVPTANERICSVMRVIQMKGKMQTAIKPLATAI